MFNIDSISINLSPYFFVALIPVVAYTIYVYRYTIPQVNKTFRIFLTALKATALLLVLFFLFEPVVGISRKLVNEPVNLIFVDDSKSITIDDKTNRKENLIRFINDASSSAISGKTEFYKFGDKTNRISADSVKMLPFSEPVTNFSNLFSSIKNYENNISSIIIVSDGVITDGVNPVYQAQKMGAPIFTVGVGDSTRKNNLEIKKVLMNEYIYAETPTGINLTIGNYGYKNQTVTLSFYEDNKLVEKQNISLAGEETSSLNLEYLPKNPGEKKLTFQLSELKGESSVADNKKVVYVNILNNKIRALVIAGSPSADLSFIKQTLAADENLKVSSITQIAQDRFLENVDRNRLIDSADVLFLVGFPSAQTSSALLNKVLDAIKEKNKPNFIVLANGIDYSKLLVLQPELPFFIKAFSNGTSEVQPTVTNEQMDNPLLKSNAEDALTTWNNLPPVIKDNHDLAAKPESEILVRMKINNIPLNSPLIVSRKLGSKKSIAVLANDIWKWKLQTAEKKLNIFDSFILNSLKWMNTKEDQKVVSIKPVKKIFSLGEQIEFTAEVYNETFNPVDDAELNVDVKLGNDNFTVEMNSVGNGIYEGTLNVNKPGDYNFSGQAKRNGRVLGRDSGKFTIGEVDIEMVNTRMDKEFLMGLSIQTGGKFFTADNYSGLFELVNDQTRKKSDYKIIKSEYNLWSNEWLLALAVLLFGLEWFFRKRSGMI
ncbi:MAG: VWA domain-containing protein [Ignavibacteriales bacterium]|nr:MAG: VWA domain-containing protein [Ignavibacteriales bacterium]